MPTRVLLTAIGSLSAHTVIRSLQAMPGTRVVGCDIYPYEWIANAADVTRFSCVTPGSIDPALYFREIDALCRDEHVEFLVPLTDVETDILSQRRRSLPPGVTLCLSSTTSVSTMRDKLAWSELCDALAMDVAIPTFRLADMHGVSIDAPHVAKPRHGRSKEGFRIIGGARDLDYLRSTVDPEDYIVQPYISSDVHVVDIIRNARTGKIATVGRTELLRTANGAGTVVRLHPDPELDRVSRDLANALDVHGCVNFEFLLHKGRYLIMDINPRFSAGVGFSREAGYDMVKNHIRIFQGLEIDDQVSYGTAILGRAIGRIETVHAQPARLTA